MIAAVLTAGAFVCILSALVRPFLVAGGGPHQRVMDAEEAAEPLLRQLRDVEDDLHAGRIREVDHGRLRRQLETQAAEALSAARTRQGRPETTARASGGTRRDSGASPRPRPGAVLVVGVVGVVMAVAATTLLLGQVRSSAPQAPAPAAGATPRTGGVPTPSRPTSGDATAADVAAVETAADLVRHHPRQPAAHVALAQAYLQAGQAQLAAVEYLATTRLDPGNAAANTALALIAFQAGAVQRADSLATRVLHDHPRYPEALYTRGLIRAMGLHRPSAAMRDLKAYQRVARFGSHRTAVATVIALLDAGAIK